jgi:4-hydroxy-tetrahydrodipicolinate reductase
MNIALVGYGKMGKAIEQIAHKRGHTVVLKVNSANKDALEKLEHYNIDVVIEFTNPESAPDNVMTCLKASIPVVCGSTGWQKRLPEAKQKCLQYKTAFLWASNFSIGVNIFFEVNKRLAALMNEWPAYNVSIDEVHHTEKKDSPSGTAITLAEQILEHITRKKHWVEKDTTDADEVQINAFREPNVPGTHIIRYTSEIDDIEIKHTAHTREGFALGAVLAAEFIRNKKGNFTMQDVLAGNDKI